VILVALALAGIGAADLVRQFVPRPRQWIGYVAGAVAVLALGVLGGAAIAAIGALVLAALWVWTMPDRTGSPAAFWPAVVLAVVCVVAVALWGARPEAGLLGSAWPVRSPFGPMPFDLAALAVGVLVFLLESGNVVVRAALAGERAEPPRTGFAGGRLIGPLERVLVLLLTLTAAYPLLAAVLAAKGIVRFPEISRDGESGARAEYFLVGSLVSWVTALAGALLVWWGAHS